jgi:hypothetical protein
MLQYKIAKEQMIGNDQGAWWRGQIISLIPWHDALDIVWNALDISRKRHHAPIPNLQDPDG